MPSAPPEIKFVGTKFIGPGKLVYVVTHYQRLDKQFECPIELIRYVNSCRR